MVYFKQAKKPIKNILIFNHICIIILNAHWISYSLHGSWIELLKAINKIANCCNFTDFTEFKQTLFWSLYPHWILKAENNYASSVGGNEIMKS